MSDNKLAPRCPTYVFLPLWREVATVCEELGLRDEVAFIRNLPDNAGYDRRKKIIYLTDKDAQKDWESSVYHINLTLASNEDHLGRMMEAINNNVPDNVDARDPELGLPIWPKDIYVETEGTSN